MANLERTDEDMALIQAIMDGDEPALPDGFKTTTFRSDEHEFATDDPLVSEEPPVILLSYTTTHGLHSAEASAVVVFEDDGSLRPIGLDQVRDPGLTTPRVGSIQDILKLVRPPDSWIGSQMTIKLTAEVRRLTVGEEIIPIPTEAHPPYIPSVVEPARQNEPDDLPF